MTLAIRGIPDNAASKVRKGVGEHRRYLALSCSEFQNVIISCEEVNVFVLDNLK